MAAQIHNREEHILYHIGNQVGLAAIWVRKRAEMRQRPGWVVSVVLNFVVSAMTTATVVLHKADRQGVWAQIVVALAIFSLIEVVKPVVDFGVVQGFLRMPFQTSLICFLKPNNHPDHVGISLVIVSGTLLVCLTLWQVYFHVGEVWPEQAPQQVLAGEQVSPDAPDLPTHPQTATGTETQTGGEIHMPEH